MSTAIKCDRFGRPTFVGLARRVKDLPMKSQIIIQKYSDLTLNDFICPGLSTIRNGYEKYKVAAVEGKFFA